MISISVTIKDLQMVACKTLIFWSLLKARWNFYWHHQSSTAVMPFPKKKASVKFSARCFITSKAKTVLSLPSVLDKWYLSTFKCKKVRDCWISRSIAFLWFFFCHILHFVLWQKINSHPFGVVLFHVKIASLMKVDENCLLFHVSHPRGSKWIEINSLGSFKGILRIKLIAFTTKRGFLLLFSLKLCKYKRKNQGKVPSLTN